VSERQAGQPLTMDDVRVRPARADDAAFVAWVCLTAARSHVERSVWDLMVPDETQCLVFLEHLASSSSRSYCHHSMFTLVEVDGRPVAGMCAYDPDEAGMPVLLDAVVEAFVALGWDADQILGAQERAAPVMTCASEEPPGCWIIECVATAPQMRGRGLIRRLLEHMIDRGRQKGYDRAQISVLIDNVAAERAYQGVGFKMIDEKRHDDFQAAFGCPGIRRLGREL
jgi:ribosomal protein S18 acetylase RimI-like enzyme